MKVALLLAVFVALVASQPAADRITSLPGVAPEDLGVQYSGYININATAGKFLHYWYVESTSGNAATDPLVLWLNGGPGCSSLDGLLYELGPLWFAPNSTQSAIYLEQNPWAWTRNANIVFLESPAGVGFSYVTEPNPTYNDYETAHDALAFVEAFFAASPNLQGREFWVTGESYAGIYVPTLAALVNKVPSINFQGVMVGNGLSDYNYDNFMKSFLPFVYGHGLTNNQTYQEVMAACTPGNSYNVSACEEAQDEVNDDFNGYNIYDVYGTCYQTSRGREYPLPLMNAKERTMFQAKVGLTPPCSDASWADAYLNMPEVKQAIHVDTSIEWDICSDTVVYDYVKQVKSTLPIYRDLMASGKRILIYSGNTDVAVPYTGTAAWINSMNLPVKQDQTNWYYTTEYGPQVGGAVTEYEGLTFVTVHGSGHMVPQYRPQAAYVMFTSFLNGTI